MPAPQKNEGNIHMYLAHIMYNMQLGGNHVSRCY